MKIIIGRMDKDNIWTTKDYSNIKDRGEIAHIICELKSIELDLIEIWENYDDVEENKTNV